MDDFDDEFRMCESCRYSDDECTIDPVMRCKGYEPDAEAMLAEKLKREKKEE